MSQDYHIQQGSHADIEAVHRFGIKWHLLEKNAVDREAVSALFQRWIQNDRLPDLLIDVADYTHVPDGPGVLLVAHEGNYALDETDGQTGIVYYAKREQEGEAASRLAQVARRALTALALLQEEAKIAEQFQVELSTFDIFINDRLNAPNAGQTLQAIEPLLDQFVERVFGADSKVSLQLLGEPRDRFTVRVSVDAVQKVGSPWQLAERLAA